MKLTSEQRCELIEKLVEDRLQTLEQHRGDAEDFIREVMVSGHAGYTVYDDVDLLRAVEDAGLSIWS